MIFALSWGLASGTEEACNASKAPKAGRSVLQKIAQRTQMMAAMTTGACKNWCDKNPAANEVKCTWDTCNDCHFCHEDDTISWPTAPTVEAACVAEKCQGDKAKGWSAKCAFRGICDGCSSCGSVHEDYEKKWARALNEQWEEECSAASSPKGKPNILVLMADDMNADGGGPGAKMPNLDYLASKGVKFTKAFADHPICAPSRAATMTGVLGSASHYNMGRKGINAHAMQKKVGWYENEILKEGMTFMEFFRSKCYLVVGTGKLNHDELYDSAEAPWPADFYGLEDTLYDIAAGFGQWDIYYAKADYGPYAYDGKKYVGHPNMPEAMLDEFDSHIDFNWARMSEVPYGAEGDKGWKYVDKKYPAPSGMYVYESNTVRDLLPDEYNAKWAIDTLDKLEAHGTATGQPWLMMVGFTKPHTPLYAPDEYYDMFPLDEVVMPEGLLKNFPDTYYDDASLVSDLLGFRLYKHLAEDFTTYEEGFKKWFQAYYACVAFLDAQIGKVVSHLETKPALFENTIIAFWADNGWNNGPKHYVYKNAPWDEGAAVPLIIRAPGVATEGLVTEELVTLVDLYPTFMDLAGYSPETESTLKGPNGVALSGTSLKSLLTGGAGKAHAVSQIYPTENKLALPWPECNYNPTCNHWAVRSKTHRYILYNNGQEELYEYGTDPSEETNLASVSGYETVKADLKAVLLTMPNMAEYEADLGIWTEGVEGEFRAPKECCQNYCESNKAGWKGKCGWGACKMCYQCGAEAMNMKCDASFTKSHVVATPETCEEIQQAIVADSENVDQLTAESSTAIAENKAWYAANCE